MLKAMEVELPRKILVHGWWQKDGEKMAKTTGNVVDPIAVIAEWGVDAFRYYVVRELDIGMDGNWTDTGFQSRYNAELANGLGNLVNRSLSMLKRYRNGIVPAVHQELAGETSATVGEIIAHLRGCELQAALQKVWAIVDRANKYVDQNAPFKLAKDPAQAARLDEVLYNLAETCRILGILLWPFLPETSAKIATQLNLPTGAPLFATAQWGGLSPSHAIGEIQPLFPRKDQGTKKS
jgi:methionyl-tRNA synthetase